MTFETEVTQALGGLLSLVITAGIAAVTPKIKKYIEEHTNVKTTAVANNALDGLAKIAESVVLDFNQRTVDAAKKANGWNPQFAQMVKRDAVAAVKIQGAPFIQLLEKTLGDVEPLIATLIERAVAKAKQK